MKKVFLLAILFGGLFFANTLQGAGIKIGKVNLGLVVSLHPQMSLFDFDRMGFFKIPPGLSNSEFNQKLKELKSTPLPATLENKENAIKIEMDKLDRSKGELMSKVSGVSPEEGSTIVAEINRISEQYEKLRNDLSDIEYQRNCPELTSPEDTRTILRKIETETIAELNKIAQGSGYSIVLNSSIPVPYNYPQRYLSGETYGLGVPGIDYSLFYAFLANKDHVLRGDDTPESRKLINWLELINSPKALNLLPLKPYPLVIEGGDDLSVKLVESIYAKHMVDEKVLKAVTSVMEIVNQHAKTYDINIESVVAPK